MVVVIFYDFCKFLNTNLLNICFNNGFEVLEDFPVGKDFNIPFHIFPFLEVPLSEAVDEFGGKPGAIL